MTRLLLIAVLFLGGTELKLLAQSFEDFSLLKFGLTEGLPSSSVYSICQDNEGRIWAGTENGLAYLENGRFNALNVSGVPRLVLGVYPARDGGVFVIGNKPSVIVKIDPSHQVTTLHKREGGVFAGVLIQFNSEQQTIYFSDWGHVMTCTETTYDTIARITGSYLISMSMSNSGNIVLGKHNGIYEVVEEKEHRLYRHKVSRAGFTPDGRTIGFYKDSIHIYAQDFSTYSSVLVSDKVGGQITMALACKNGDFWYCGSESGLYKFDGISEQRVDDVLETEQVSFSYLFEDAQGNIWCGTNGEGLILLRKTYVRNIRTSNGLAEKHVMAISDFRKGSKLVRTKNAAQIISADFALSNVDLKIWGKKTPASYIKYSLSLPNTLLIGANFQHHLRCVSGVINDSIPVKVVFSSRANLHGNQVDIGSWGIFKSHDINSIDTTDVGKSLLHGERFGRTNDIISIDSGAVAASETAIFYWNQKNGTHSKMPGIPSSESAFSLAKTRDDSLWCITENGFYGWDGEKWRHAKKLLLGNQHQFKAMVVDEKDRFWLGTENGLILLDGIKRSLYTTYNGLAANSINSLLLDTLDESLWIGTESGLSIATINDLIETQTFGHKVLFDSLNTPTGIKILNPENSVLPRTEKMVTINFSVDDYFRALPVLFKYRIRDENGGNWQESVQGTATFQALTSGNYSFDVKAQISGSQWSEIQTLHFTIKKAFWTRWEFYLLLSVSVVLLTLVIYKIRITSVRRRELEKRQVAAKINELEIQALNANMNPHFIFNSLNSIQHYLVPLKNRRAFDFISNLSRLIRLNMAALGHKEVNLAGELKRTELYVELEKERLNNRLTFEIELDIQKSAEEIFIPSMMIQPLVENSIWHGIAPLSDMGLIRLQISNDGLFLKIVVTDNGVGLEESAKNRNKNHESVATNLTKDRLEHHHTHNEFLLEELRDANGKVLGTKATIKLHQSAN